MDQINSEILRQFENQGLTINEGVAIDARLVKSTSRPISNKEIKKQKKRINTPEGKLDKNSSRYKFWKYDLRRFLKYFLPTPDFRYFSLLLASSSFIHAS